tara:strand:+ start:5384 stop:5725 length:342 start_codon:yes stop_codon:yes gene_type:complete
VGNNRIYALRRKSDFQNLAESGKSIRIKPWLLLKYKENQELTNRFGWSLSKKVGNSVVRNRLKRWLREFFRYKSSKKTFDFHIILLPMKGSFYKQVSRKDFDETLEKAWKKIH